MASPRARTDAKSPRPSRRAIGPIGVRCSTWIATDIVLQIPLDRIGAFVADLGADFEIAIDMLRDALLEGRSCSIFYLPIVMKIDLFAIGAWHV